MSTTIKEQTDALRWALENTALTYENAAASYRRMQSSLPEQPINAPTAEAMSILARHGFVVIHRDRADAAIHIVRMACEGEHESSTEADATEELLGYLKAQRQFCNLRNAMSAVLESPPELLDRAEISAGRVLVEYSRTEAGLAELKAELAGKTYDLTTTKGDAAARADRLRCVKLRTALEAKRKEFKQPALLFGKTIDSEAARITAAIEALEQPIDAQIRADETRRAEEKAERVAGHRARIAAIRECVTKARGLPSSRIANGVVAVEALVTDEATYQEFAREAADAKTETLAAMRELFTAAKAVEDAAAAQEAQRVEQARVAEEQRAEAARLQEARDLIAKAEREAAERLAAERAAFERERAEFMAAQEAAKPKMEAPQAGPVGDGSQKPDDGAAIPAAEAGSDTEARDSQQVLKAEAATPDATDRDAPVTASPSVGSMGAGQPADAGATGDTLMLLRDALALTKYAAAPFFSKFSTHPKTTPEWWAGLREQIETLQPLLVEAIERAEVSA